MYNRTGQLLIRKYNEYILPTILTSMAVSLSNVINMALVGQLMGDKALSAIGLASPIIFCCNAIFLLFAVGGVTCASIAGGKRDTKTANIFYTLTNLAGILAMVIFAAILLIFLDPIAKALTVGDPELYALTKAYIGPVALVGLPMNIVMTTALFMRLDGKPKSASVVAVFANVMNILFVLLFVGYFKTGIAGAAWSMVLGFSTGLIFVIKYFMTRGRTFRLTTFSPDDLKKLTEIVKTGSAKALLQVFSFLRSLCLNTIILMSVGSVGVASMVICTNALLLANIFIAGADDALLPIVGTLYGEKDKTGIRHTFKYGFRISLVASFIMAGVFLIFSETVVNIFGIKEVGQMAVAATALRFYALSLPFYASNVLLQNYYQTTKKIRLALLTTFLNTFALTVSFAWVFSQVKSDAIWFAFLCAEMCTLLIVQLAASFVRKKGEFEGLLLLPADGDEKVWESSARLKDDVKKHISNEVKAILTDDASEEAENVIEALLAKISQMADANENKNALMDIVIKCDPEEMTANIRSDAEFSEELQVINKSAKIEETHSKVLGFHCSQIRYLSGTKQ